MEVLISWQFILASCAIYAIISVVKRLGRIYIVTDHIIYKTFITLLNLILGAIIALPPGFIPGDNIWERVAVGIVAGFFSNYSYQMVKRFMKGEEENDRRK